ncbi:hypothetical protein Baya_11481 [Bagarius yarrelli]|uniref:Uncharacterized protein n=1 Tax=Bagarius yarrelli TaxID=175774 RepID=A0A556V0J3_BAGYA|nr:hypothetical protein Baya_11481 [Bagarius yarrelli]
MERTGWGERMKTDMMGAETAGEEKLNVRVKEILKGGERLSVNDVQVKVINIQQSECAEWLQCWALP